MASYISKDVLRKLLGNIGTTNVPDEVLTEGDTFCNGTINSKLGVEVPVGNIHYGKCVGIAYMLGKVFAQYGNETEKVRSLDFDIAMKLLQELRDDMVLSGTLNDLLATDVATIDDGLPGADYLTDPLNEHGVTVYGARSRAGVTTSVGTRSKQIVPANPE